MRIAISAIASLSNIGVLISALTRAGVSASIRFSGDRTVVQSAIARLRHDASISAAITLRGDTKAE